MSIVNRRQTMACLAGAAMSLRGQQQEEIPSIKIDVDLVSVMFSVRNKNHALVSTLGKDDFTVYEDGKPQTIKYFSRETDLPLTLGLLVDVSGSQESLIPEERQAAGQFFDKVLRPKDMAYLISFGAEAELLQDSTNSVPLLKEGLSRLRLSTSVGGLHPGPVPTAHKPKGTILYDAVYMAADEKMKREVGRKAIILITDGMDYGSTYKLRDAIEMAQKADTIVYSLYYADSRHYFNAGIGSSDSDLKRMSEETGGRVFHVSRRNSLDDAFTQIQEEMRAQYALAYAPTNETRDGSFRKLEIKPKEKGLRVQARKGYYATPTGR